jgi:hypothetical protein
MVMALVFMQTMPMDRSRGPPYVYPSTHSRVWHMQPGVLSQCWQLKGVTHPHPTLNPLPATMNRREEYNNGMSSSQSHTDPSQRSPPPQLQEFGQGSPHAYSTPPGSPPVDSVQLSHHEHHHSPPSHSQIQSGYLEGQVPHLIMILRTVQCGTAFSPRLLT